MTRAAAGAGKGMRAAGPVAQGLHPRLTKFIPPLYDGAAALHREVRRGTCMPASRPGEARSAIYSRT